MPPANTAMNSAAIHIHLRTRGLGAGGGGGGGDAGRGVAVVLAWRRRDIEGAREGDAWVTGRKR